MTPDTRINDLTAAQRASILRLKERITGWFDAHPDRARDFQSITLFGSQAIGRADSELSDWDLYVVMHDDAPDGASPAEDVYIHENCPTEWHRNSVSGYLRGLNESSLSLSCAVEKFGVPIYRCVPDANPREWVYSEANMDINQFVASLLGVVTIGERVPITVSNYLDSKTVGFSSRTRSNEPYDPIMFKDSSNFAEHVAKLIVAFRGVTPRTVHELDKLAEQLASEDAYRDRIAALNGATRDGNISIYSRQEKSPEKVEDEPVEKSKARLVDAFRLLQEFLTQHADDFDVSSVTTEVADEFRFRFNQWDRRVCQELSQLVVDAPAEHWIESLERDSNRVLDIFDALLRRVDSVIGT